MTGLSTPLKLEKVQGVQWFRITSQSVDYYGHYAGDRRDSDELELTFPEVDGRRRSVRFQNDEHIIPNLDSGATLTPGTAGALKPVSEHVLTPVPSPIPPELLHRDSVSEEVSKDGDGTLVETLLLRLLDDINNQRLSRHDLETLTSYCLQILRSHDLSSKNAEFQEKHELKRTTYSEVASELAQFTLEKILDDIKSGSVNDQDLTSITLALVRQRKQTNASPLENFVHGHILETLDRIVSEEGGIKSYVSQSLNKNEPGKREESFVAAVLSQAVSDIKSGAINDEDLKYIGSVVAANNDRSSGAEMSESEIKLSVEKVLNKIDITDLKKNNTIYSIISAYYTVNQRNKEAVKGFVLEAFPKICAAMKAPKSDRIKKNIKEFSKDLKDKSANETDINHLGLQILYVGKKCLPPTLQDACTSYKEIVKNIKRIWDRNEFQKEAEKVMYEFFTKDKKRRIGAMHGRPLIYIPSQESKVAINVVLGTMDRIIRDVYTQHIPPELLTALASEMYALCKKHDSIFDPTEEPAVNVGMPVLYRIYEKFRENKISFKDAKWIFATIFQTYSDPNSITVATEFQDISPNDRALIGNLVDETINKIVQTVAMEIKQELGGDTSNISVVEIEDLVREELYGLNESDDRSRELHHIEGDLEEILQGCLNKAARDIARHVEGVESETTVVKSRTKLSDMCFMEKVVDFILSAIDNLAKNAKSDDIKSSTLVEFLNRVLETDVKKVSPKQHQKILEEIRLNLEQNREESKYFPNLASLFSEITLDPRPKPSGLKEIPEIISSMESDVLMEFVQAAMFCVLSYIQGEQTASKDLPINDEFSFQRIESLLLVRKVLNYVVQNVSDIVEANGTKKSASKSLLKRFSSKKLDHKDTRSLYECIICAFKDAKAWLYQQRSVTLTPNVLATTDEKVLEHILDVTDLIQRKCDGKGPQSDISDEFEIICEMMINTINDIERGLDDPKELKLAFGSPVTEFDEESIQQYVLEAIKDALFHSNSSKKLSSVSDLSSGSSQTMIKIFALVLTNTIENIQNDKMPTEELKTLVDVLQNAAGLKVNVDFKDLKSVKNSVIQYLNKFKDSVDKGNVDDNTIQEVTKQIAMVDTSKTRSINRENSIPPVSSEGNTQHIPTSVSNKPSEVIENMVKSVLSSVVADQKSQTAEAESGMKSNAVVNVEGKSSEVDNEKDPSLTTLKPILGSHPLDVGEDVISSALSHITKKPRATHHNPPEHEPRQSYRSLTCPDVHNYSQTKQAITEMIGTERAGSGAILSLKEESESIESIETSYSAESCNSVTGLKPKTASESAVKSNTSLRKGVSMETESTRSRESVKKQTSLGNSSIVASKKRSETIIKSSSIGSNKQKDSDVKKHTSQAETTNQSTDDNTSDLSDADYHYLLGRAND